MSSRCFVFLKFLHIALRYKKTKGKRKWKGLFCASKLSKHQSMEIARTHVVPFSFAIGSAESTYPTSQSHANSMASLLNHIEAAYQNCSHVAIILRIPKGSSSLSHCYKSAWEKKAEETFLPSQGKVGLYCMCIYIYTYVYTLCLDKKCVLRMYRVHILILDIKFTQIQ